MFTNFPLFPQQASAQAGQVDAIYFFMVAVTAFFSILIAGLVVFFAIKYRRRHRDEVGYAIHGSLALELLWTVIPFIIVMLVTYGINPALIAIILGVDRILDMCRTTLNVAGDITAATYVARSEGYELLKPHVPELERLGVVAGGPSSRDIVD